jgi:hypothetical protein
VSAPDESAAQLVAALERTKEAGPASCTFEWRFLARERPRRRSWPIEWLARRIVTKLREPMKAEGVVDLGSRRVGIDFGSYALVVQEGREWSGRSGRTLASLPSRRPRRLQPLWLFDLMTGATEAHEVGVDDVGGRECRHLSASADAVVAATKTDFQLPQKGRLAELRSVPFEVWIDAEGLIRRIRCPGEQSMELDLHEYGVTAPKWASLPVYRSAQAQP